MAADVLFLDSETLEGVPYMVASFLATFPRAFHKQVVQLLCKCILPTIAGVLLSSSSAHSRHAPRAQTTGYSLYYLLRSVPSPVPRVTYHVTRTPYVTCTVRCTRNGRAGFDVAERSLYVQESFAAVLSTVFQHVRKPGAHLASSPRPVPPAHSPALCSILYSLSSRLIYQYHLAARRAARAGARERSLPQAIRALGTHILIFTMQRLGNRQR